MPPKPGNAFAQQKEIERQASQKQQHTRNVSKETTSSSSTVRLMPGNDQQGESSAGVDAHDLPDIPQTTMAMFTEESDLNESQESLEEHTSAPLSRELRRKQKKKSSETKRFASTVHNPLSGLSSTVPEPPSSERLSGMDFIKSTFSKGKKALTKTSPFSTVANPLPSSSQPENTFTGFNFEQIRDFRPSQAVLDSQEAIAILEASDRDARGRSSSHRNPSLPSTMPHQSGLSFTYATVAPAERSSVSNTYSAFYPSQQGAVPSSYGPALVQQLAYASRLPSTTSQQLASYNPAAPANITYRRASPAMWSPTTTQPSYLPNIRASAPTSQIFNPRARGAPAMTHAPPIPASMRIPQVAMPQHYKPGHLSTGTNQTYTTSQSQYTSRNDNSGMILSNESVSPTRQGTYAITGNPQIVTRQPVPSMTGIIGEVPMRYSGPQRATRLNAPLSSLPFPTPDPAYITTTAGTLVPLSSLYNLNASEDTKSEGDLEVEEEEGGVEEVDARAWLLRRSGGRRAFSCGSLVLGSGVAVEAAPPTMATTVTRMREKMERLEEELELLRREVGSLRGKGKGKGEEEEEEEVLWRRPRGVGRVGEIGRRWYREEMEE